MPAYAVNGDTALLAGVVRGSRRIALAGGTVVALIGIAGIHLLEAWVANEYVMPLYLALVCVPLYALTDVQDGICRGNGWMATALLPPYVLRPAVLLVAMTAAWAADLPMNATTACTAAIAATWLTGLVQALLVSWYLPPEVKAATPKYELRSWLKLSLPLLAMAACEMVMQNADVLILTHYMTPIDVGIYFAAAKTMALVMFVHYAVGSAVANRFSTLNARGDKESLRAFVKDAVNWTFWPSLAGAVVILALGKPLLWLFGPDFDRGYPVMFILVVGFLFRASMGPVEFLLNMLGEQALCATVLVVTAVLNLALNFALVPSFGLTGAAIATSISLITAALMNTMVARSRLEIESAIWQNMPRK